MKLKTMCQKFWNQVKNLHTLNKTVFNLKFTVPVPMILKKKFAPKETVLTVSLLVSCLEYDFDEFFGNHCFIALFSHF